MQLTFTGRNLDITEALRQHAAEKLRRLQRFVNPIESAHVILSIERHRQIAEVTLRVRDLTIRGEETSDDLYCAIDLVADKLERQVVRYKEKILGHSASSVARSRSKNRATVDDDTSDAEDGPHIVKVKRFAIKPLSLDEAAVQMDLVGHDFFVFRNARTEEVNVLYRRRDGNYGLIEPTG
jgi:putative sigma-54 modulation protein